MESTQWTHSRPACWRLCCHVPMLPSARSLAILRFDRNPLHVSPSASKPKGCSQKSLREIRSMTLVPDKPFSERFAKLLGFTHAQLQRAGGDYSAAVPIGVEHVERHLAGEETWAFLPIVAI